MPNDNDGLALDQAGVWAKKYFLASRTLMEAVLRPYDLGSTQWYVLHLLDAGGATNQRALTRALDVERATLSGIVGALTKKGLIEHSPDPTDQRQKVLRLTPAGAELYRAVPNPIQLIASVAFADVDPDEVARASRVLKDATARLVSFRLDTTSGTEIHTAEQDSSETAKPSEQGDAP